MLFMLLAAAALTAANPETIVVTGVPLKTLREASEACARSACSVRDDVVAAVRYAEGLFRTGRYVESRTTLQRAIVRTRGRAESDVPAMSALYEATATVARHEGDQAVQLDAVRDRARLFDRTAAGDTAERLLARLDLLDAESRFQPPVQVLGRYAALVRSAREAGLPAVTARTTLHYANLAQAAGQRRLAESLVSGLAARPEGAPPAYQFAARALAVRFARERGDQTAVDRFVREAAGAPQGSAPVLVWAPPVPQPADPVNRDPTTIAVDAQTRETDFVTLGWVDVGFTIKADGTVDAPDVLRSNKPDAWAGPLLRMIAARRYAPLPGADDARYRVERWTMTADYAMPAGSLIRRRVVRPHYEQLDVTTGEPRGTAS